MAVRGRGERIDDHVGRLGVEASGGQRQGKKREEGGEDELGHQGPLRVLGARKRRSRGAPCGSAYVFRAETVLEKTATAQAGGVAGLYFNSSDLIELIGTFLQTAVWPA